MILAQLQPPAFLGCFSPHCKGYPPGRLFDGWTVSSFDLVLHHIHFSSLSFIGGKDFSCLKNVFFQRCNLFLSTTFFIDFELMLESGSLFITIFGLCFEQPW